MPKNKPSEETLAQARRVIDALNERGAHKQAIRLKVTRPDAPPRRPAAADRLQVWWPTVPALRRVCAD